MYHRLHIGNSTYISKSVPDQEKLPDLRPNLCPPHLQMLLGNGMCDDDSNIYECGWDNYECCWIMIQKGKCTKCQCHENGLVNLDVDKGERLCCLLLNNRFLKLGIGATYQIVSDHFLKHVKASGERTLGGRLTPVI